MPSQTDHRWASRGRGERIPSRFPTQQHLRCVRCSYSAGSETTPTAMRSLAARRTMMDTAYDCAPRGPG
jgi:hypothetical protein